MYRQSKALDLTETFHRTPIAHFCYQQKQKLNSLHHFIKQLKGRINHVRTSRRKIRLIMLEHQDEKNKKIKNYVLFVGVVNLEKQKWRCRFLFLVLLLQRK